MKVKFVLTMDDVVIDEQHRNQVVLDWVSDVDDSDLIDLSAKWTVLKQSLTDRMVGLLKVGHSSISFQPV